MFAIGTRVHCGDYEGRIVSHAIPIYMAGDEAQEPVYSQVMAVEFAMDGAKKPIPKILVVPWQEISVVVDEEPEPDLEDLRREESMRSALCSYHPTYDRAAREQEEDDAQMVRPPILDPSQPSTIEAALAAMNRGIRTQPIRKSGGDESACGM